MITDSRAVRATVIICAMCVGSCSSREPDAEWDGSVRDSAGVEIVVNNGPPLWDTGERWRLSEVLRVGVSEGAPEYMFGALAGLGVLSDGRIVIADGIAHHLRFFFPDGRWQLTVGRAGSGPGEFGAGALPILVGPGDTLLVVDARNQRVSRIGPDGMWLDAWRSAPADGWMVRDWDYAPSGVIVSHMTRVPGTDSTGIDMLDVVVARDLAGSVRDTVGWVPASALRQYSGRGMEFFLYAGEPVVSLCPDNTLVTGRGDRYEIRRYDPTGRVVQVVRLERGNVPITDAEQVFLRQRFKEIYLESGFPITRVEELLAGMHFTETYPAFVTLACGPHGSIWVQPARPVSDLTDAERQDFWVGPLAEASAHFDVFDRRGRYLGVVPLPEGFWPGRFHGDALYGRWRDSLDVEYVKVMRVEGLAP